MRLVRIRSSIRELASQGVTFNDFIIEMAPGIIMTIIPSFMLVRWLYKDEFSGGKNVDITELEKRYPLRIFRILNLAVVFLVW